MDHIMPKNLFPEFSVHAQNLFPCCVECNSYKSETWLKNGNRQILNLYLDILPSEQYLFVEINIVDSVVTPKFYLENKASIEADYFQLILSHYKNLHLLDRFGDASNTIITELKSALTALNGSSANEIESFIAAYSESNSLYFGYNYWKDILRIALSKDKRFLTSCKISFDER